MMSYKFIPIFLLSSTLWASPIINTPEQHIKEAETLIIKEIVEKKNTSNLSQLIDEENLRKDKTLTQALLDEAIKIRRWDLIAKLLPIYNTFYDTDATLIQYAHAGLARQNNNIKEAISIYRSIMAEKPQLTPVRFELASTLFEDKQDEASQDQFNKVLAENPPHNIQQISQQYLEAIAKRQNWSFNMNVNFLEEKNINNLANSREIENTGFIKNDAMMPKTGRGLQYAFSINKNINLHSNHYIVIENSLFGKNFWNHHDFDEIQNRVSIGYSYQDSKQKFALLPFYEKRWYSNKQYQDNIGVRAEYNYWVSNNLQTVNAIEYAKQRYKRNTDLNGHYYLFSSSLFWLTNAERFFFIGADFNRETTGISQYNSSFKNIRLGWGEEWKKGISTRTVISLGQRRYHGESVLGGILPLGRSRKDNEININFTIWKRDWHFWGVTPKINYNWKKVNSNIPTMFSYNKSRFMIILEKTF